MLLPIKAMLVLIPPLIVFTSLEMSYFMKPHVLSFSPSLQQLNSVSILALLPTPTFPLSSSSTSRLPSPIQVPFASPVSSASLSLPHFPVNSSVHLDLPVVLNTHPMITRIKYGIQKKKAYLTQQLREPRTYLEASKHQVWIDAMDTE